MNVGDRVNYTWTPRGGYCVAQVLAAKVLCIHGDKASIMLAIKDRDGQWQPYIKRVACSKLSPSNSPSAALDEIERRQEHNRKALGLKR